MGKRISLSIVLLTALIISLIFHPSVFAQTVSKYDYIEYHTTAEGKEDFGDYDPINSKYEFETDEGVAVLVFAFNRLDGYVDLEFNLYKDENYITTYDGWADGDGRRWVYDFNIYFEDLPLSDVTGAWEVYTYIDGEYAFTDEFFIMPSLIGGDGPLSEKYDYIEYYTMSEGTEPDYPYAPINPKSVFYQDEGTAVLAIAFNRLEGRVDLEFDLYKDGTFVTSYDGSIEGDGREWFYNFYISFEDPSYISLSGSYNKESEPLFLSDLTGNWEIDAYIDGNYAFTREFSIIEPYKPPKYDEDESFWTMLIVAIMFYLVYIVPYIVFQVIVKKRLKVKSMMIGGTLVFVFFIFILIPASDGDGPSGTETLYLIIGAFFTLMVLRFFEAMYSDKEKETPEKAPAPPPPQPAPVEKEERPEPKPEPPKEKPAPKKPPVEHEPPKKSGPVKNCPCCKGKLSELNFYKLKSGNDVTCEYCGEIISS